MRGQQKDVAPAVDVVPSGSERVTDAATAHPRYRLRQHASPTPPYAVKDVGQRAACAHQVVAAVEARSEDHRSSPQQSDTARQQPARQCRRVSAEEDGAIATIGGERARHPRAEVPPALVDNFGAAAMREMPKI